ncbi:MAG: hypothetical protein HY237_06065 [Acidobacteria bacterium]|nr:hypothetical protein [Acidobacteriota bacterium]
MKRSVGFAWLALLLASVAAAGAPGQAPQTPAAKAVPALPTVDQILDKYVQALGGKTAIEKLSSRVSKGTFEIPD